MDNIRTTDIAQLIDVIRRADGVDCGEAEDELVAIGTPAVAPLLAAELPYPAQYRIWRALGRIGDPRAIPTLMKALTPEPGGPGDGVQLFAAEALGRIGEPALRPLLEGLDGDNAELRHWTAWALGQMRDRRAVVPLLAHTLDPVDEIQGRVFSALYLIGDRSAAEPLMLIINESDLRTQRHAVNALGSCVQGELYPPLVELAQRPGELRLNALIALRQSAGSLALPIFRPLLDDADSCVRIEAIKAFGLWGDSDALPLLEAVRPDDEEICGGLRRTVAEWRRSAIELLRRRLAAMR